MSSASFHKISYCLAIVALVIGTLLLNVPMMRHADAEQRTPIAELLEIVKSPAGEVHPAERNQAVQEIGMYGTKAAAEALAGLLNGESRLMAALSLEYIKDPEAVPVLAEKLNVESAFTRACLCGAIGSLGGDEAVQTMMAVAKNDSDAFVRQSAIHALRMAADNHPAGTAMPALCDLLEIEKINSDVVASLLELSNPQAVARLQPSLTSDSPLVRALVCEVIKRKRNSESTDALIALIDRERNAVVLGRAITALAAAHPQERAEEVAGILARYLKNEKLRETTVDALYDTVSHEGHLDARLSNTLGKLLLPVLDGEDARQRHIALKIYRKLGFGPAASKLIKLIPKEEDSYIREDALCALAVSVQTQDQVAFLFGWRDKYPDDEGMVEKAIALLENPVALPNLIAALQSENDTIPYTVIPVLARIGDNAAARPLLDFIAAGKSPCEEAAKALLQVAGKSELAPMAEILKQGACARTEMGEALLHIDRIDGFQQIRQFIASKEAQDMRALHIVLERWHALPKDEPILSEASKTADPTVRRMAVQALGRIGSPVDFDAVCTAFRDDPDNGVRSEAAKVMGYLHHARAIQCLADGFAVTSKDANIIGLNEKTLLALRTATGQRFDNAEQWQAWVRSGMGIGKGIDGCIEALAGDNLALRMVAANRIADWPNKEEQKKAIPFILQQLEINRGSDKEKIAWARMLGKIQHPAVRGLMLNVCGRSTELEVRTAFAGTLYRVGDDRGVETLLGCLDGGQRCPRADEYALLEALAMATDQPYNYSADYWRTWWGKR